MVQEFRLNCKYHFVHAVLEALILSEHVTGLAVALQVGHAQDRPRGGPIR